MRRDRGQRGTTLIELMVSLVISSLVVYFLFSIHTRMSSAFRSQERVAEVIQALRAARNYLLPELRMAGFTLPEGEVAVASTVEGDGMLAGFEVWNDLDDAGPDAFRVVYADASRSLLASKMGPVFVDVDDPGLFRAGDRIVIASRTAACLVEVTGTNANKIHFNPSKGGQPFNEAPQNRHCDGVRSGIDAGEPARVFAITARAFRIDTERGGQGFLQMSPSGALVADDWIDLGIGFTNLQLASRFFEPGDSADVDGDGDPERDWYSSDNQGRVDPSGQRPADARQIQISLSLETRSPFGSRGAPTAATAAFVDLDRVDHNRLGDWGQACPDNPAAPVCGVDLAGTPDAGRPARYRGDNIYRSSTTLIDLRNLGVGL